MKVRNNTASNMGYQVLGQRILIPVGLLELDDKAWSVIAENAEADIESGALTIVKAPVESAEIKEAKRKTALDAARALLAEEAAKEPAAKAKEPEAEAKPEAKSAAKPAAKAV